MPGLGAGMVIAVGLGLTILVAFALFACLEGRRPFVAPGADPAAHPFHGAGGDPALLAALRAAGLDLANIGACPLPALRAALMRCVPDVAPEVLLFRGRVVHNVTRRGVAGFVVTPLRSPASERAVLRSRGNELVPAITDAAGRYTLVGLPRGVELTNVLERRGFLALAYTARTSYPTDYLQDHVGTVPAYLVPSSSARDRVSRRGELALTIVFESAAPDAPDFGLVTEGKYERHGVAGVRFRLWRATASAGGAPPATTQWLPIDEAGAIVYADSAAGILARRLGSWTGWAVGALSRVGLRRVLELVELPAADRCDTSALGLALARSLPEGWYEVEALHPTLECQPTRDAWRATATRRCRVEVVAGTMGDARFYCRRSAVAEPA